MYVATFSPGESIGTIFFVKDAFFLFLYDIRTNILKWNKKTYQIYFKYKMWKNCCLFNDKYKAIPGSSVGIKPSGMEPHS